MEVKLISDEVQFRYGRVPLLVQACMTRSHILVYAVMGRAVLASLRYRTVLIHLLNRLFNGGSTMRSLVPRGSGEFFHPQSKKSFTLRKRSMNSNY